MTSRFVVRFGLFTFLVALLMWPAILYRSPGYLWDSSGYFRGGRVASAFAISKLRPHGMNSTGNDTIVASKVRTSMASPETRTVPKPSIVPPSQPTSIGGFRSMVYSVVAYWLAIGSNLWPLIIVQSLSVGAVLVILIKSIRPTLSWGGAIAGLATIAAGTTLPPFLALALPDIFAGVLILCALLLAWWNDRLRTGERIFLVLLVAFAVAAHASHVALAAFMLLVAAALASAAAVVPRWHGRFGHWRWSAAGMLLGIGGNAALGLVGFGEVSVAPKHFPFALARSVEDGPAYWYLQEECPRQDWAVCELYRGRSMPRSNWEFLWGANGVVARASPLQMNHIRAEEPGIVRAAIQRYPWFQIKATLRNVGAQMTMIGIDPVMFQQIYLDATGHIAYRTKSARPTLPWLVVVHQLVLAVSLFVIALGIWRCSSRLRGVALLTLLFILANDAICGGISAPDIRYQNRVLWLVPLIALLMVWERRHRETSALVTA